MLTLSIYEEIKNTFMVNYGSKYNFLSNRSKVSSIVLGLNAPSVLQISILENYHKNYII